VIEPLHTAVRWIALAALGSSLALVLAVWLAAEVFISARRSR
jgi:hypothetical protein